MQNIAPRPRDFRPSRHGFRFANSFEVPVLGPVLRALGLPATWGLCGGMVQEAREAYCQDRALPKRITAPAPGTPFYRVLFRQQLDTLGPPPFFPQAQRFARWTCRPDAVLNRRTREEQRKAQELLAQDRFAPLGLIYTRSVARLWENHQVLAYAESDDSSSEDGGVRVYDPNDPRRDDVAIVPAEQEHGPAFRKCLRGQPIRNVRGFFVIDEHEAVPSLNR